MEMSPHPEKAIKEADRLRDLVPDSGHLQHMATHIDVLCGHYQTIVDSNDAALVADRKFQERDLPYWPKLSDIPIGVAARYSVSSCHNYHFKVYGAMFLGQYRLAIESAEVVGYRRY